MIRFYINIVNTQCRNAKYTAGCVIQSKALPNAGETYTVQDEVAIRTTRPSCFPDHLVLAQLNRNWTVITNI